MGNNGEAAHVFVSQPAPAGDLKRLLGAFINNASLHALKTIEIRVLKDRTYSFKSCRMR